MRDHQNVIEFSLYHCKGAGGNKPGNRVEDVYDVCGQVIKSIIWNNKFDVLIQHMKRRMRHRAEPSRFITGSLVDVEHAIQRAKQQGSRFQIIAVQPGITQSGLTPKMSTILAAADTFIQDANCAPLRILGSA